MTADERADEQLEHIRVGKLLDAALAESKLLRRLLLGVCLGEMGALSEAREHFGLPPLMAPSHASADHE